jgi:hypothetical protein
MREAAETYTSDTSTMQGPQAAHGVFYNYSTQEMLTISRGPYTVSVTVGEIDSNVTEEDLGLSGNFDTSVFFPQPQQPAIRVASFSRPIHEADTSGHTNIDEGPIWIITPQEAPVKISSEADQRIRGHENLLKKVYAIIQDEAGNKSVPLSHIEVLSDWSNEYDEQTGIVIYIQIQGTADDRFAFWDTIANSLEELEDSLLPDEHDFLISNVSVVVNRA